MKSIKAAMITQSLRYAAASRAGHIWKRNFAMAALLRCYRALSHDPEGAAPILGELLGHSADAVRLSAAVQSLALGQHITQAEALLEALAQDCANRHLRIEAELCLAQWRKRELRIGKDGAK